MKKRYALILIILILFIIIFFIFLNRKNYIKIGEYTRNNEDVVRDIIFEPYSLNENNLKILVVAEDKENGIKSFKYTDENENVINEIQCNNKIKASIDIDIIGDHNYKFTAISSTGEEISKTLEVNEEYRKNLINIQVEKDDEAIGTNGLAIKGNIKINFGNNDNLKMNTQYKIGNGNWIEYEEGAVLDCSEIVSQELQEDDNKTIIIYARKIDENGNQIITNIETKDFDVDAPVTPQIIVSQQAQYPVLTSGGIYLNNKVTIQFDRVLENVKNEYSLDGGDTWLEADELTYTFNTIKAVICARSIKESGLTITKKVSIFESNVTTSSALASDALNPKAYDGNNNTYIDLRIQRGNTYRGLYVS